MPDLDRCANTVAVFGHPNHEIAIFGTLSKIRPRIVYLTDGGGEKRVAQTKEALTNIGVLERALFLNHTEGSFYDAVLRRDAEFFKEIGEVLRSLFSRWNPCQILCDAVEFYNPVHDITMPIVRFAARNLADIRIFEIPLIYQDECPGEHYILQNVPCTFRDNLTSVRLSDIELDDKIRARDQIYTLLAEQLGSILLQAPAESFRNENLLFLSMPMAVPGNGRALRYESRAKALKESGDVDQIITYDDHYLPVARSVLHGISH